MIMKMTTTTMMMMMICRDPRDIAVSWYNHRTGLTDTVAYSGQFADFLHLFLHGTGNSRLSVSLKTLVMISLARRLNCCRFLLLKFLFIAFCIIVIIFPYLTRMVIARIRIMITVMR